MNCWHRLCPFCTMSDRPVIGVRYCGGCNPRYNRTAAVEQLRAVFPDVVFCPAARGQALVLVVCGCSVRCADVSDLDGKLLFFCKSEDFQPERLRIFAERLREAF